MTMTGQLNYYDILGVVAGASADDVQRSYDRKMDVLAPAMIAGAPSQVITAVDRARVALDLARRTLIDPAAREQYDMDIGIVRPSSGLARPFAPPSEGLWDTEPGSRGDAGTGGVELLGAIADWLAPHPGRRRHVAVPDARGLFVSPGRHLIAVNGLRVELIQLANDPIPVEGLVVDQSPRPGTKARRSSTVKLQVWHPSRHRGRA